jgi:hypothetical protein
MIFHVLGSLEGHSSTGAVVDLGTREAGTVPGVLLLHPNARVRTDELVHATWPEPAAAKANLKTYVSQPAGTPVISSARSTPVGASPAETTRRCPERLGGRHASAVAATSPIEGGTL